MIDTFVLKLQEDRKAERPGFCASWKRVAIVSSLVLVFVVLTPTYFLS